MNPFRLIVAGTVLSFTLGHGQEWTRFRGPNGTGISSIAIPAEWNRHAWVTELPGRGHSSPVIWGDRLFVTSAPEDASEHQIHCLHADTGRILWSKSFPLHSFKKHQYNSFASPTPAVDADRVYLSWAVPERYAVMALDHEGSQLWEQDLGPFQSMHGSGTSPVVYQDRLILGNDQQGESSLVALDRQTGDILWKTARPSGRAAYSTPCIYRDRDGQDQLIFASQEAGIAAIQPSTGAALWSFAQAFDKRTVSSPFVGDGVVFGSCGSGGGGNYLVAVQPPSSPGGGAKRLYQIRRSAPYVPTGIAHQGRVFAWSDAGIVSCLELATGRVIWQERVEGRYFGSPVLADDLLFAVSDRGEVPIVRAADTFELVARNQLPEGSHATPALANQRLFIHTFGKVICIDGSRR